MAAQDDARDPSDSQPPADPNHVAEIDAEPQLSTPPGELNGLECKTSRKREREVSLEPATPQAASQDIDPERPEGKERRTPAKKNRTSDPLLEVTQEEVEDDAPANGSPPHETKIRQISQGVEDITWQNMKKDDSAEHAADHTMEEVSDAQETKDNSNTTKTPTEEVKEPSEQTTVPPLLRGENPPILNDTAGDYEDNGAAAGAKHPADSHISGAPEPPAPALPASSSVSTSPADSQISSIPLPKPHRRDSDSSDQEKGLKRKLGDRTVSESLIPAETVPGRNGVATVGATKRPRDDAEADPNTREKKRPTPPPEEEEKDAEAAKASSPKPSGFMAYASTSSPFASVPGPRLFGGKQPSTSPWTSATAGSSTNVFGGSGSASPFASSSTSPSPFGAAVAAKEAASSSAGSSSSAASPLPHAHKRTGFEAFASSRSPFASAAKRPKSPPPASSVLGRSRSPSRHGTPARATSAFSAYAAGGAQSFAAPTPKRPGGGGAGGVLGESSSSVFGSQGSVLDSGREDEDSEKDSGVSFGERLRAQKDKEEEEASDEEKRLNLTEQEVVTGEEEEDTVYQVRGKLFVLSSQNQWKERGTGMLRLNVRRADGTGARLVMRKEAVYTVLLNATLFKGMKCFLAQDPRYLRFSVFEGGVTSHYNLRVSNAKIAEELLEEINAHIPTE